MQSSFFKKSASSVESCAQALGLKLQQLKDFGKVRKAYKIQMAKCLRKRSVRVQLNRAYSQACAKIFKSDLSQIEIIIISGDLQKLKNRLNKDKKLLNAQVNKYPIIYLAVRSGHYDIVEYLLRSGCSLNFKGYRSTPMHCAAYYGHYNIIPLLLMYGMPIDIKNQFGSLPIEQAANPEIQKLLKIVKQNKIQSLNQTILQLQLGYSIMNISYEKQVVFKKIVSKHYFQYYDRSGYVDAFHGTCYQNLISILQYGLRKPGDLIGGKPLDIVKGHIPLGVEFQGKKNWSKAIFVSPSIYYAAHPVYSKQFIQDSKNSWLPLVQVKVKKGSFTRHDHTLKFYDSKVEEPSSLQFRVQCSDPQKDLIMRTQSIENVIVIAILLVRKGFLEDYDNYNEVTNLILNSDEEEMFRKLNK